MKRIFCDCCGDEFQYENQDVQSSGGKEFIIALAGQEKMPFECRVQIDVRPIIEVSGDHVDMCGKCRWLAVSNVKAITPVAPIPVPRKIGRSVANDELDRMIRSNQGALRSALVELQAYRSEVK